MSYSTSSSPKPYRPLTHTQNLAVESVGNNLLNMLDQPFTTVPGRTYLNDKGHRVPIKYPLQNPGTSYTDHNGVTYNTQQPGTLPAYRGQMVADLTPQMQALQQQMSGFDVNGGVAQSMAALSPSLQGQWAMQYANMNPNVGQYGLPNQVQSTLTDQYTKDYIQRGLIDPAYRNFDQNIAPRINESYAGYGSSFSSRRGFDTSNALSNMNVALQAQEAGALNQNAQLQSQQNLQGQMFNADAFQKLQAMKAGLTQSYDFQNSANQIGLATDAAHRQLSAAPMATDLAGISLSRMQQLEQMQAPFQQNAQMKLDAQMQDWMRTQPQNNPAVQYALAYGQSPLMAYQNPSASPWSSLLAGVGGQAGGQLLSKALAGWGGEGLGASYGAAFQNTQLGANFSGNWLTGPGAAAAMGSTGAATAGAEAGSAGAADAMGSSWLAAFA